MKSLEGEQFRIKQIRKIEHTKFRKSVKSCLEGVCDYVTPVSYLIMLSTRFLGFS